MQQISDAETLLTLLRENMPSAVVSDENFVRCAGRVDPAKPHVMLEVIGTIPELEDSSAHRLLERAYSAACELDSDTALALPLRYGPSCSMWTLFDAPYANGILTKLPAEMFEALEGKPCPSCGETFERDHRCRPGSYSSDAIPF